MDITHRRAFLTFVFTLSCLTILLIYYLFQWSSITSCVSPLHRDTLNRYDSSRDLRVVWVGGQGRSGTTLVRAMLDAHPALNCGPETILLADLLGTYKAQLEPLNQMQMVRTDARDGKRAMQLALRAFIQRVLVERADGAPVLCNKEPHNLRYGLLLHQIFPNSKFVFVIRDGRAVCRAEEIPKCAFSFTTIKNIEHFNNPNLLSNT